MEIAIGTHFLGLYPKMINHKQRVNILIPNSSFNSFKRTCFSPPTRYNGPKFWGRESKKISHAVDTALSGAKQIYSLPSVNDVGVSSSQFEDFSVTNSSTDKAGELKISVEVLGAKTQVIFDTEFEKIVAAAQPIPGFRRVKGGKTPDIPRDILLEVLGYSKVYKQVIEEIINSTIAEYVEKQDLKVSKDLRVEQSFEDLEDMFEPGETFSFDAVIQIQKTN